jgi:hypothetical protein
MVSSSHTHRPIHFRCCVTRRTPSDTGLTCSLPRNPLEFLVIVNTFPHPLAFSNSFLNSGTLDGRPGWHTALPGPTQSRTYAGRPLLASIMARSREFCSADHRAKKYISWSEQGSHVHCYLLQQGDKVCLPVKKTSGYIHVYIFLFLFFNMTWNGLLIARNGTVNV